MADYRRYEYPANPEVRKQRKDKKRMTVEEADALEKYLAAQRERLGVTEAEVYKRR